MSKNTTRKNYRPDAPSSISILFTISCRKVIKNQHDNYVSNNSKVFEKSKSHFEKKAIKKDANLRLLTIFIMNKLGHFWGPCAEREWEESWSPVQRGLGPVRGGLGPAAGRGVGSCPVWRTAHFERTDRHT